jgi:hypothetical protein
MLGSELVHITIGGTDMRASFRKTFAAASGFLCVIAFSGLKARAQEGQGVDPRVSFFAGASLLGGGRTFFIGPEGFNTKFQNGAKFGVRGDFNIRNHWAVEGTYGFESDGLNVARTTPAPSTSNFGVHIHQLEANGLYYFNARGSRFRPFLTAGFGIMRYNPTGDARLAAGTLFLDQPVVLHGETHPDFVPGAGIEARIVSHISARLDFRDHITGLPRFGLQETAQSASGPHYPISGVVSNWEFSAGIIYHFQ